MNKHSLLLLAGVYLLAKPHQSCSQNFLGLSTQSNSGFFGVYQNPAFLADKQYAYRLQLVSADVQVNTNYVRYAAPFSMLDLLQGKNDRPLDPYDLVEVRNNKPKNATLSGELRGPALALRLGPKTNLAILSRVRSAVQVTDASARLMAIARLGLADASNLQDLGYLALYATQSENRFNLSSIAYAEWAFSIGQVLFETETSRLKGGFTLKRFFGNAGGYVQNQNLNYRLLPDPQNPYAVYMQVDDFKATMGYTELNRDKFLSPGWLFGKDTKGKGWGWDVGLSYEVFSDEDQLPDLRLSASLIDKGQIQYQGNAVKNYNINASNQQITEEEWRAYSSPREGENQLNAFGRLLEEEFGLQEENNTGAFTMATPSALNLSADLKLGGPFFVNALLIQTIRKATTPQWQQTSLWAITPRFETRHVGLAFPIIRQNTSWAIGAGLRAGPVQLGSDNLLGLLSRNGRVPAQGVDIYAGVSLNLKGRQ